MLCLGLEGTAHTFSAGIVTANGRILANVKDSYVPKKGGIHPREAADHHADVASVAIKNALDKAKVALSDIDLIAFSAGPGLSPTLRVTAVVARTLAVKFAKPILAVQHGIAHIEIAKLTTGLKDPVILFTSGGHTSTYAYAEKRYREFGATLDITIGNMFDQIARAAGLPHPGGPKIEELAKTGSYVQLPYVVKGMDLSFSGILSEATRKLAAGEALENVCYSLQETCFAMLTEVVERAVAHTGKNEVLLTGGVAANRRLQEMLAIMCRERGARFSVVPAEYSGDNGAMIAWTGILAHKAGQRQAIPDTPIRPRWRTDEVDVAWL